MRRTGLSGKRLCLLGGSEPERNTAALRFCRLPMPCVVTTGAGDTLSLVPGADTAAEGNRCSCTGSQSDSAE